MQVIATCDGPNARNEDPLSILFLIRRLGIGGAQTQLIALAGQLAARGHRVAVVTFYASDTFGQRTPPAVTQYSLEKRSRWDVISPVLGLIRFARRFNPQIVHGYMGSANVLLTLLRPWLGSVRVVWGIRASDVDHARYGVLAEILWRVERALSSSPDLIIFNSRAGHRHAVDAGFRLTRSEVIPNGVSTDTFKFDVRARSAMRSAWAIPPSARVVGMAARIDPMKGHSTLLKAVPLVLQHVPDAWFVCVGDGHAGLRAKLEAHAAELGVQSRVLWVGGIADMASAFSAFDVAVLCSEFGEGFPNVVAEAMACERPCVVTDVGDAALVTGPTGQVVPVRDHESLATALIKTLRGDHVPGSESRRRVEQEFSLRRLALATEKALRELRSRPEWD